MDKELQLKRFLTRNQLFILNNNFNGEFKESFIKLKMTTNLELEKEILQMLDKELRNAYEKIYSQNEQRREKFANETVKRCSELYIKIMTGFLKTDYVKPESFDGCSTQAKDSAKKIFTDEFCDEEKDLMSHHLLNVKIKL
jgi:hypothetical protein